jgi:hypothetical protein
MYRFAKRNVLNAISSAFEVGSTKENTNALLTIIATIHVIFPTSIWKKAVPVASREYSLNFRLVQVNAANIYLVPITQENTCE